MVSLLAAAALGAVTFVSGAQGSYVCSLPENFQSLFNESMNWLDTYYDPTAGYLYSVDSAEALHHETRSSAWYAVGLLARNEGDDVAEAEKIIRNVIAGQYKDPADYWYADYQQEPEEPLVGSPSYPGKIYGTYDGNWREFIGTTLIIGYEEFPHLLSSDTKQLIMQSLYNASLGDTYRNFGVDDDNITPAYDNPSIMRAFLIGWTGHQLNNSNFTTSAEKWAQETIDLYNEFDCLSEFNSGTYTGVSLWGLTLWAKYLPANSTMTVNGPRMIEGTWNAISQLWHPQLKNMAGPWDRAYGYDMNRYVSLMALWFWMLGGKETSSLGKYPQAASHSADFAYGPMFVILGSAQLSLIPDSIKESFGTFSEHTFTSTTYSPPYDYVPRNITSWLADDISIGAESFDQDVVGGASINPAQFNPAVIQWNTGSQVGFISLHASEMALQTDVSPYHLNLTYPYGNSSSIFSLIVSTFNNKPTVYGWEDVQGLAVTVSGNVNMNYTLSFAGIYGGSDDPINDFEFWNFTYSMPEDFEGSPNLVLDVELV